jgi:hypothetical protein
MEHYLVAEGSIDLLEEALAGMEACGRPLLLLFLLLLQLQCLVLQAIRS